MAVPPLARRSLPCRVLPAECFPPSVLCLAECPMSRRGRSATRFAETLPVALCIVRFAEGDSFRAGDVG